MGTNLLIFGYSNVAVRIAEYLATGNHAITFVLDRDDLPRIESLKQPNLRTVPVARLDPEFLSLAAHAPHAVFIATDDEQFNIHAAMVISARLPGVRVVTRLFNLAIGRKIEEQLPNLRVLSVSELAAPYFAATALCDQVESAGHDGSRLVAHLREGKRLVPRNLLARDRPCPDEAPGRGDDRPLARLLPDRFTLLVLSVLFLVVLLATSYFAEVLGLRVQDALYFVVTTLTTTGYGDFSLKDAPFAAKLVGMGVMLFGASLFAILFALLTDRIFRTRLDYAMGRRRVHLAGHVIVCGAGDVGIRVVENLLLAETGIVVIERDADRRFNQRIRELGVPLILADATLEATLVMAGVRRARSIVCATDNDMRNLEIALGARALHERIRTVLRIFDRPFADRIQQNFRFDAALSSSAIAAPAFAAAAGDGSETPPPPSDRTTEA